MNTRKSNQINNQNIVDPSNKQNQISQTSEEVTKAKKFTQLLIQQKEPRHGTTYMPSDKILNQRTNKTTFINSNHRNSKLSTKIDDLQIVQTTQHSNNTYNLENPQKVQMVKHNLKSVDSKQENKLQELQVVKSKINNQKVQQSKDSLRPQKLIKQQEPNPHQQNLLSYNSPSKSNKKVLEPIKPSTLKQIHQEKTQSADPMVKNYDLVNQSTQKFQKVYPEKIMQTNIQFIKPNFQIFEQCSHVMKSIKKDYTINHAFNRHKSCMFSEPVTFQLPKTHEEEILSQKSSRLFCSQFKIYLKKNREKHQLGTLKSNFTGSVYNFYPYNTDIIHFSIIFDKMQDIQASLRYSQIYINQNICSNDQHLMDQMFIPYSKMESLEGLYRVNQGQKQLNNKRNSIFKFTSKLPGWSQVHQSYNLDFGNERTSIMPSVKNTIFIDQKENQVMKFYKSSYLTYNVSFKNPFSWIVAYGYALASTDFKIATQ